MDIYIMIGMIGGLIPTYLISRLFLWLMKTWSGGSQKLFVAHGMSLVSVTLIGGIGMADGGAFAPIQALLTYFIPQAVCLIVDIVRNKKKVSPSESQAAE